MIKISPNTREAYQLLHEGAIALAQVERNGIRVDVGYCRSEKRKAERKVLKLDSQIENTKEGKMWRKKYREKTNFNSSDQLSTVLFKLCGYEPVKGMSTSADVIGEIGTPFTDLISERRSISLAATTFFGGILRQTGSDGIMHPDFNLNTTTSFRSTRCCRQPATR